MRDILLAYEQFIRLAAFCGVFALMAIWELIGPRRTQTSGRWWRWPNNLGVVVVDTLLVRILFPTTAVGFALITGAHGLGLFNMVQLPAWIGVVASVILLVTGGVNPRIDGEACAGEDKGAVEAPGLFNGMAVQSDGLSVVWSV